MDEGNAFSALCPGREGLLPLHRLPPWPLPGPQTTEGAASPETPDSARAQSTQAQRCEPCIVQPFRVSDETKNDLPSRASSVTRLHSPAGTSPGLWPSEEGQAGRPRGLAGVSRGEGDPSPCRGRGTRDVVQKPLLGSLSHQTRLSYPASELRAALSLSQHPISLACLLPAWEEAGQEGPSGRPLDSGDRGYHSVNSQNPRLIQPSHCQ